MRISDWSSDVCSSDLESIQRLTAPPNFRITNKNAHGEIAAHLAAIARRRTSCLLPRDSEDGFIGGPMAGQARRPCCCSTRWAPKIGRESCRARVFQDV